MVQIDEVHCSFQAGREYQKELIAWREAGGVGKRPVKTGKRGLHKCSLYNNHQLIHEGLMSKVILPDTKDIAFNRDTSSWIFTIGPTNCSLTGNPGQPANLECLPQEE